MNLPNKLTILRVIMIPVFVLFMLTGLGGAASKWIALALFVIASLTDLLDGHLARKHNLVTNFGKFMDPLADKLLVCAAMICLVENGIVMEAVGKWCFMHFGESYMTQLSDVTNILFMMKRTLVGRPRPGPGGYCRILGLERCYSLYFLAEGDGFCLIPCWRIETDTMGEFVYSALDGTLYTKMDEIT